MDRWLINTAAKKSNEEKIPLSSSERPGTSTCSYELQPGTSFQSISYVEDQKEQLDPQTSSVMEIENEKSVDNCTEDEEEGYNTENEKKQFKQIVVQNLWQKVGKRYLRRSFSMIGLSNLSSKHGY
ncbi:hypothetical protein ACJJTC_004674 [Scirpophaga incertulas]